MAINRWQDIKRKRVRKQRSLVIKSGQQLEEEYMSVSGIEPAYTKICPVCNGSHFEWDCPRKY